MTRQLAFDLPAQEAWQREDFFVSPGNALALATVEDWRNWPGGKLLLIGPPGSGKTHLAHLMAEATGGRLITASALPRADLPALAAAGAVAVEDAAEIAGNRAAEEALFHLHNMLVPGGRLLVTAPMPVRDWGLGLADLHSRLAAAPVARLDLPDDALLSAVLVKLFADRQVAVPPPLIPWLVARMERSLAAAREIVAEIDARALAEGRPIGRTIAEAVLDRRQNG